MKRVGNLYDKVCDYDNCRQAIVNASRTKRKKCRKYLDNLDYYTYELSKMLKNKTFKPSPYNKFIFSDGLGHKEREISTTRFYPDQCVQWALIQVTGDILRRGTYNYSCACIKGRGALYASNCVRRWMKKDSKNTKYCLKLDVHQFYPSINNGILKSLIRRLIKDKNVLSLYDSIIDLEPGIPIGTVLSPYFADVYLQSVDYLIKQECRGLCRYYIRYADDMCIFGANKRNLHKILDAIKKRLEVLHLEPKDDYQIFLVERIETQGKNKGKRHGRRVDFCGYAMSHINVRVRKRIMIRIMRTCRKIADGQYTYKLCARFVSYMGWIKYGSCTEFKKKYITNKINIQRVKEVIRNASKARLFRELASSVQGCATTARV